MAGKKVQKVNGNQKGKVGERELAGVLRKHGFQSAHRGQQFQGSPDSPDVCGLPGVHIECKRVEALRLYPSLDQAKRDAGGTNLPVVVHRPSRRPWVAILDFEDFLTIYKDAMAWREFTGEIDAVC